MEGKDNRSKDKRRKMKMYTHNPAYRKVVGNSSSSSTQGHTGRKVFDVADSSNDRLRSSYKGWGSRQQCDDDDEEEELPPRDMLEHYDNNDDPQLDGADFEELAKMPLTIGGHFQFSSEKNWQSLYNENDDDDDDNVKANVIDKSEASEYFKFNSKLLNAGLHTIPFHKRMDLSSSMFSKKEIKSMEKKAEDAEKYYQSVLKEYVEKSKTESVGSAKSNKTVSSKRADSSKSQQSRKSNESIQKPLPKNSVTIDNKQDIQDWLDQVLEI